MLQRPNPEMLHRMMESLKATANYREQLDTQGHLTPGDSRVDVLLERLDRLLTCALNQSRAHMITTPEHALLAELVAKTADAWLDVIETGGI